MYPSIHLRPQLERRIRNVQHPWIFSGALVESKETLKALHGKKVRVMVEDRFLAVGVYNAQSQIAVRVFSWEDDVLNKKFFKTKIASALYMRECLVLSEETTACRVIFAESDGFPGFIMDKYGDVYVMQIHALAGESCKEDFVAAFAELLPESCLYEVSDSPARVKDGLSKEHKQVHAGTLPEEIQVLENGLSYFVDVHGQKTGLFVDQRENRLLLEQMVSSLVKKKKTVRVLNLFSYTGGFSLAAARGGAGHVLSVDTDASSLTLLKKNFELNSLATSHEEKAVDVFTFVDSIKPDAWEIVILDPPAFVKSLNQKVQGMKGYLSLNQKVLEKMSSGSYLFTFSCSGAVSEEDFVHMINWASHAAKKEVQIVKVMGHPIDHPLLASFPEGKYLKGVALRVV